jgi:hypothetical protein
MGGGQAGVVGLDGFVEERVRLHLHLGPDPFAPLRVHEVAVARRVDLDVVDAFRGQARELVLHDGDDVPEQRAVIRIDRVGDAPLEADGRELRGAGQGHLDGPRAVGLQERQLMPGQRPHGAQLRGDDTGDAGDVGVLRLARLPGAAHGVAHVESLDGVREVAHEVAAPQLAVGEDREAELGLFLEDPSDVPVFEVVEALGVGARRTRIQEVGRPQEAPHLVRSVRCRHAVPPWRPS